MSKRPVAFRVPRLCGDIVSHYFVTTSEDEARAMADTNQVEYEGLYLVGDRYAAQPALTSLPEGDRGHTAALREILAVDFGPDPRKLGTSDFFAALARIRRIACDALTAARDTEGKADHEPRCNCGHLFELCPQADCTAIEPLSLPSTHLGKSDV